jgi:hypothetical protein
MQQACRAFVAAPARLQEGCGGGLPHG